MDRTLLVPSLQLGHRHRASDGFASAGGKGINVARALKRLDVPVVCTGLAGGRTGTLIVEDLTHDGILNDFVRIDGESRTSTVLLDPTSNVLTEIYEWGPEVAEPEIAMLGEKLSHFGKSADYVVFAGSLPRGVDPNIYAELIRAANKAKLRTVLDAEGEALRVGVEAEPFLVSPNQREAEGLVGHEFTDEEDLEEALGEIAGRGARNVLITHETGCYALLREGRKVLRLRARAPELEAVSEVGAGDTLVAAFLAAHHSDRPLAEALRNGVAAGAASVLEAGPGRFDTRELNRLAGLVAVEELDRVEHEVS